MIVRCSACGAEASIDTLVDNDAAAQALNAALALSPIGKLLVRYLALFRPEKRRLTWPRVAALLGELLPQITAQRIERDGRVHEAPLEAWASGLEKTLAARDAGILRTPLKSHGYLLEVVIAEAARGSAAAKVVMDAVHDNPEAVALELGRKGSAVANAMHALNQRKRSRDATST